MTTSTKDQLEVLAKEIDKTQRVISEDLRELELIYEKAIVLNQNVHREIKIQIDDTRAVIISLNETRNFITDIIPPAE